jgi:hypothetical protein
VTPRHALRKVGPAHANDEPGGNQDARLLADEQASHDAVGHRTAESRRDAGAERDTRVREGKQRNDEVRHPRVEPVFEPLQRCLDRFG